MKIFLSHPTGNRNVRAVLESLDKVGMLAGFNTTVAASEGSSWLKFLPKSLKQEWLRRSYPGLSAKVKTRPFLELARLALPKLGLGAFTRKEHSLAGIDAVYRDLDRNFARSLPDILQEQPFEAVYAYEDGAYETFKMAKHLGLKCIYDLPIAYWETSRRLLLEESERLPAWSVTLGGGIEDSPEKLRRKTKELELADVVVGPGSFVRNSLPEWSLEKKIIMSPFGSPEGGGSVLKIGKDTNRPLRVLFVGSMGQRKGLGDLFNAVKMFGPDEVELVILGLPLTSMEFYRGQLATFIHESARPHHQVLELMRSCDVFCLPSIVEGRALVMQEAMSQGLPLIITENTGGADLVQDGYTGFLVPIRSPEAIAEKISWFLANRSAIPSMGNLAMQHAATYSWQNYGSSIVKQINEKKLPSVYNHV
ncbi:glycosyltransferase family 4 protein [Arcticibacter sp.]|jgi:glycosyltransferase involved in cell wall biosynthesis|uniref:glycosyltransferase family 4 protein n=1 Tax=Arcticibacter sp. TaxID=1872630 RepID=UPI00388DCD32